MAPTDESLVDAWEFLRRVIEPFFGDPPRAEVDGPPVQRRGLGDALQWSCLDAAPPGLGSATS
jgi:hypothetical protein